LNCWFLVQVLSVVFISIQDFIIPTHAIITKFDLNVSAFIAELCLTFFTGVDLYDFHSTDFTDRHVLHLVFSPARGGL